MLPGTRGYRDAPRRYRTVARSSVLIGRYAISWPGKKEKIKEENYAKDRYTGVGIFVLRGAKKRRFGKVKSDARPRGNGAFATGTRGIINDADAPRNDPAGQIGPDSTFTRITRRVLRVCVGRLERWTRFAAFLVRRFLKVVLNSGMAPGFLGNA